MSQDAGTDIAAIARWSGIVPPNDAAHVALADIAVLIADLERLRGGLAFDLEPADFEQAMRDCREPAR